MFEGARRDAGATTLLSVVGLGKRFGAYAALRDVSVEVAAGEVVGIIGTNGAGKTTFVNLVTGWVRPSAGVVRFGGVDVTGRRPRAMTRLGLCRSFQVAQVFSRLSALENMVLAAATAEARGWGLLRDPDTAVRRAAAMDALGRLGLADQAGVVAGTLPQGRRKLLDIGMALAARPRLLLLDEPTSGVGADEKLGLMDAVMPVLAAAGATVLFIEHDMEVVERYCSRVLAFMEGRIVADGTPASVLAQADVRDAIVGRRHARLEPA